MSERPLAAESASPHWPSNSDEIHALLLEVEQLRRDLARARGGNPMGFWSQSEWEQWSNDLTSLIPEDDEWKYSNPEGAQESIIKDCLRAYVAERLNPPDQRT